MNINDFLGIAIVGAALSGVIEFVKAKFVTRPTVTKFMTVGLSVVVGGLYVFLQDTVWWSTILGVLAAASTVYALFLKS